jgi:hypothetical protein
LTNFIYHSFTHFTALAIDLKSGKKTEVFLPYKPARSAPAMTTPEQFLSPRKRYQPIILSEDFSDEEMVRDWTLSAADKQEIGQYRKNARLWLAIQLCAVRRYGRFLKEVQALSPRIVSGV